MTALLDALQQDDAFFALPGPRSEAWRSTSLRALERRTFAAASAPTVSAETLAHIPAPRIVLVNGQVDATLSTLDALPSGVHATPVHDAPSARLPDDEPFAQLAQRRGDGIALRIDGRCDVPLHLVLLQVDDGTDARWHARHRISLETGAALALVEHHIGDDTATQLTNVLIDVEVGAGAELRHLRLQQRTARTQAFQHTAVAVAEAARYRRLDVETGAALSRHTLAITLAGNGAQADAHGLLFGDARRHIDTRLTLTHAAADTTCDLQWRGLAMAQARVVLHGGIVIEAGADDSRAELATRNLLLSEQAQVDAQPVLVIHADDVQAAHGATVGQLDANALFYLRSRGIDEDAAKRMLTAAFCRDTLAALDGSVLHAIADAAIDIALTRMQDA